MNHRTVGDVNHRTVGERAPALSAEDLAALRENLHEQLRFRREQIEQLTSAAPAPAPGDGPGERRAAARIEVGIQLAASARMVLADVEAALRRMDEGRYGFCCLCRRPVARELLAIVPQARHCARCRQVREAGR
ncbi:TraR/DksA family transcriptional regulator [Streptomyces sp. NPDC017202]|uniref:TraR/DksA family transcriptional regulator n=1 Tax=Streptomyces sp. NPDC017202 TaxID=3364981 RepID=UPI0037953FD6